MKNLIEYISESNNIDLYNPKSKKSLEKAINTLDPKEWNKINTSSIKDMLSLFRGYNKKFGDISNWDVSNVSNMNYMFTNSSFNGDISNWDVSNVKTMERMFHFSSFNGDISNWDVSNVRDMDYMFNYSKFNGDINDWDVSNVIVMDYIFDHSPLEKNPPKWYNK